MTVNVGHETFVDRDRVILCILVGGLEHEFYDFTYIGKNHPN